MLGLLVLLLMISATAAAVALRSSGRSSHAGARAGVVPATPDTSTKVDRDAPGAVHLEGQLLYVHRTKPRSATLDGVGTAGESNARPGTPFTLQVRLPDEALTLSGPFQILNGWVENGTVVIADVTAEAPGAGQCHGVAPAGRRLHMRSGSDEVDLPVAWTAGLRVGD